MSNIEIYRVEHDTPSGRPVGMFLAQFFTDDENVKNICKYYRNKAPWMPEPEHQAFSSGIPHCVVFGCTSPQELMAWFGYSKVLLRKVLKGFKIRVYSCSEYYQCNSQVGFSHEDTTNVRELTFEEFNTLLRNK